MRLCVLACLLGMLWFVVLQAQQTVLLVLSLLLLSVGLIVVPKAQKSLLVAFMLGVCWIGFFFYWQQQHLLPLHQQKRTLQVNGYVASLVAHHGRQQHFLFSTKRFGLVQLNDYHRRFQYQAGQVLRLSVSLKRPWGFHDPGVFDYQRYLFMRGVNAVGYVKTYPHLLPYDGHYLLRLRAYLSREIAKSHAANKRFIQAVSIGDRQNLKQSDWVVLQATGTNHLVAISGLHVGLISGLVFFLVGFLWRRSAYLCLLWPTPQIAAVAAIIVAVIYSALAGFAVPTQRALIMLCVFMSGFILRRTIMPWNAWCLALLLVILFDPLCVLGISFWLSFAAVGFLIYGMGRQKQAQFWSKWLKPQIVVVLGVTPFTLLFFQQASLISPLANAIAIPWVGFIVVPLSLLTCCSYLISSSLAHGLLVLAAYAMQPVWWLLSHLAMLPYANLHLYAIPYWAILLAIASLFWLLSPKKVPCRCLSVIGFVPLFLNYHHAPKYGQVKFTLLDVGQGLASVVQTAHHVLVYDTGPKFSATFDAGSAVVVPYLQAQGINRVDTLVISHGDNDHIGGAYSLIKLMPVKRIVTSVPKRFKQADLCLRGQHWQWDGVRFQFLYPSRHLLGLDNNSSCVLRIATKRHVILLTGDIEKLAEDDLIKHEKQKLKATLIVAPHHGSQTSSTPAFVAAVHPRYVLYPVGYLNRYHFPSLEVTHRYQALGAKSYDTVHNGAITKVFD